MGLIIPASMEAVIHKFDGSDAPLDEGVVMTALSKARPPTPQVSAEQNTGAFAEIAAWHFSRPHGAGEQEPWGIYWGPIGSGTLPDGKTPFYNPDVGELDDDIVNHWITRASNSRHPIVKARYADLAWDIGRYLQRPAKVGKSARPLLAVDIPVALAHKAVDAYLDAVQRGLAQNELHSWKFIDRAISLSIALNDKGRIAQAKTLLFSFFRRKASRGEKFHWSRLYDLTESRGKTLELTEGEDREITESLQAALARHSDISNKDSFDPHQATDAVDRLVRRLANDKEEIKRVVKQAGKAFESVAKDANGTLAIAWLEDVLQRYRNVGLSDDAVRVEAEIGRRADQARAEMKRVSIPVTVPNEEVEKWLAVTLGDSLPVALSRIAWLCVSRKEAAESRVKELAEHAPLSSMMSVTIMGHDGFTEATLGSIEDDLEGRTIHHVAQSLDWNSRLLDLALSRAKDRYKLDVDAFIAHLNSVPFFATSREPLLREGLSAWLGQDATKAIHVLVPQLEAACRDLLAALGAPTRRHDPKVRGFEVIGMGAVLSHAAFRKGVPEDIRFHLVALYSDPRGINLRNHIAHGIAHPGLLTMGLANWVLHSLLLLAILRMKKRPTAGEAPPPNPPANPTDQGTQ